MNVLRLLPYAILVTLSLCSCQPVIAPSSLHMSPDTSLPAALERESARSQSATLNQAPHVDAGAEVTITLPGVAMLEGTVLDDGHPDTPGDVSTEWTMIDGAGDVTFTNAAALETAVSFSRPGVYTLDLAADDGEYTTTDQTTVTVNEIEGRSVIHVPEDAPTIKAGIDIANDGDLVLIAPGEYHENLWLSKTITLASWFHTTGNPDYIEQTILDGNGLFVLYIGDTVGPTTTITGLTIRNGGADAVSVQASINILYNHFIGNEDDISYFSGGGLCRKNTFDGGSDNAIDLAEAVDVVIADNVIADTAKSGIDIELTPYSGPMLNVVIRDNLIAGSGQSGIRLTSYDVPTDRAYVIKGNVITGSKMSGLGLMDNGLKFIYAGDDYRGASLPERILLVNNTFIDNEVGVSGGDNLVALNNIFIGHPNVALNNVDGDSIASHNLFWNNGEDQVNSNLDAASSVFADPMLDVDATLLAGSPAIDAGAATFTWNSETILDLHQDEYKGAAPDIGALESQAGNGQRP